MAGAGTGVAVGLAVSWGAHAWGEITVCPGAKSPLGRLRELLACALLIQTVLVGMTRPGREGPLSSSGWVFPQCPSHGAATRILPNPTLFPHSPCMKERHFAAALD